MTLRRLALASLRQQAFELILTLAVLVFCLLIRPPIEVGTSGPVYATIMGLVALLLVAVPGTLLLMRFPGPRHWIWWSAVSVVALLALTPLLFAYYELRALYSVDFEGRRVIVGDENDLTDIGRLHRELHPSARREELVRLTAGQPQIVWAPSKLHGHAQTLDRYDFLSSALAGLAAIGLAGAWRSRSRSRAAAESPADRAAPPAATGDTPARRFRVALSFPGEVRERADAIARSLEPVLGRERVFYDRRYAPELARPNMDLYLQEIYRHQSDLLVVMLCAEYHQKEWCGLEWRVVRDLVKARESERIMFLRLDDTAIEGLLSIDGYLDIVDMDDEAVAAAILSRGSAIRGGPAQSSPR